MVRRMPSPRIDQVRKGFQIAALCFPMLVAFTAFVVPVACTLAWYHGTPPTRNENLLPAVICGLIAGRIDIQPFSNEARINGPKVFVEILRSRLRLHSHITGMEHNLRDSRSMRILDRRLKRVQISIRPSAKQWEAVGKAVVAKLVEEGAEVLCDIHLLAQSDDGIRASFIENTIRPWLHQEHIQTEIHKDITSWDEQASSRHNAQAEMTLPAAK
jgi:hypothetical protein